MKIKITRKCEQFYADRFENLNEIQNHLPKVTQEEMNILNIPSSIKKY